MTRRTIAPRCAAAAAIAVLFFACARAGQMPPGRASATTASTTRERTSFDFDWQFHAGEAAAGQLPAASDPAWQRVDLPHDFVIRGQGQNIVTPGGRAGTPRPNLPTEPEGPFDPRSPGTSDNGYLNGGIGWYSKTFSLPTPQASRLVFLEFEGVYMNSEIWLNGERIGARPYGYSTFEIELTPKLKFGTPNVITLRVNVQQPSTRWYSGGGIYRHVWLTTVDPVHIDHWGVTVMPRDIRAERAQINVRVAAANQSAATVTVAPEITIRDRNNRVVSRQSPPAIATPPGTGMTITTLFVPQPHLWSIDDPYLYSADVVVRRDTKVVDSVRVPFGIRTIAFTADSGFVLNGKHVPLRGVCLHHDLGPLGSAAFDRGIERELQIMKEMGVNAIRTSHNPPAPALLDYADRMGFVVMDEVFDEWKQNKTRFGYGQFFDEWSERDTRDMVRRDRNHPSVVMWSIGNEIPEQGNVQQAEAMATRLAGFIRAEDSTRFVTSAMNNPQRALTTGFAKPLDLFGVNYNLAMYPRVKGTPTYASETSSNYSSRDQYNLVLRDTVQIQKQLANHTTSYDLDFPSWGNTAEKEFQALRDAPWMAGEFVWTGFDYIGEPTPFSWPNRSSSFGIVDLVGMPKDRFYLYQSQWRPDLPMVHILPHWNWGDEFKGKSIPVWTYTNADSVELLVNNRSMGKRNWNGVKEIHLSWSVPYEAGSLRAVAWKGGRVVAADTVVTTGSPTKLVLTADRSEIRADGQDLAYVTVRVVDANGRLSRSNGNQLVKFTLSGGGSIAGVDNGDPTNHEAFVGTTPTAVSHRAFNGIVVAVIRAPRTVGTSTLSASVDGLGGAQTVIRAR